MEKKERMYQELIELITTDSASGNENEIAHLLEAKLNQLGFQISIDDAGKTFGGNCGNLFAVREGELKASVMFCSHMDRVPNGYGIHPVEREGILYSNGETILAADDVSGICAILEGVRLAIESGKKLPRLEILFTVGEEAGLFGAKAADVSQWKSDMVYVMDSSGHTGRIIHSAPGRSILEAHVTGKAAHAGIEPEKGIDAAKIMCEMLATMKTGRIDENTTSNFSTITTKTSKAMNIVCDDAVFRGEMRSREKWKMDEYASYFKSHCEEVAAKYQAGVEIAREDSFFPFTVATDSEIVSIAVEALKKMGIEPMIEAAGGAMDANIFNAKGKCAIGIATGYFRNHTSEEYLHLDDFYQAGILVKNIIEISAERRH